ncbi:zinc dependent phospholipase C family protein [Flavisolibacter tropicus]|uniref:S1/P1 Nuclease n=1 Tax=Flavisolibacter tropicus TaxID=1492898 RepID=A0A172TYK3_9BACT|nr:zinc dependent phospholipase C family protein [Flavisolibacter tropicus]ANE52155.1 S1/P1 Nuclease [Flavisolibacter tropicus]
MMIPKQILLKSSLTLLLAISQLPCFCWGFYGHQKINYQAVFLLPPQLLSFYKKHIQFISEHAVDPDKRRYMLTEEGPRHYIDIDRYGAYPFDSLPRRWDDAIIKYTEDTLQQHGIVPWWIQIMQARLTNAFKEKNTAKILKLSADIGHYIGDAHVPLHVCSNHNGQYTGQRGIHGFWESRVPELLADKEWDFFIGKATYIKSTSDFIWKRVLESAAAADTVLLYEKQLSQSVEPDQKFAFENRNGKVVRQYSTTYTTAYDRQLKGMVERRMRQSIYAVASFWYTAWVNAGQPDLSGLTGEAFSEADLKEFETLNERWKNSDIKGREHE